MEQVKAIRKKYDNSVSMNDVVMAAITGAMRKYAIDEKQDRALCEGSPVEFKSLVMIALPRKVDESDLTKSLCNKILFSSTRLPIGEAVPSERLLKTKAACDDLKSVAYMTGLKGFTDFISGIAPRSLLNKAAGETWSKHTLCVTNVPTTTVPMTWPAEGGETVREISIAIANVMSQISVVTYNGEIYASLMADPELLPKAEVLGQAWLDEMKLLAA